jgi:MFS superfamily sulfate permease-like transporter
VNAVAVVITVILLFFVVGVLAGVAVMYALSARRAARADSGDDPAEARDTSRDEDTGRPV